MKQYRIDVENIIAYTLCTMLNSLILYSVGKLLARGDLLWALPGLVIIIVLQGVGINNLTQRRIR